MSHRPVRLAETTRIARPSATVWAVVADYGRDIEWRAGLTEMTPDPVGPPREGTRVHEVLRTGGRTYVTDTVVSDVQEGVSYRFSGSGTSGEVAGRRTVVPLDDTRSSFTYEIDLTLRGATRLVQPLGARVLKRGLRKDLTKLRRLVEADNAAAPA